MNTLSKYAGKSEQASEMEAVNISTGIIYLSNEIVETLMLVRLRSYTY